MKAPTSYPDGWGRAPLSSICHIQIGGTPSRDVMKYWAAPSDPCGLPWVSIGDLTTPWIEDTKERITEAGVRNSNVKLVRRGTTLMSFKLSIGKMARAGVDLYTNEAIAAFEPQGEGLDPNYLFHALPGALGNLVVDQAIKGATLNKRKLAELSLPLPQRLEQARIAEVLDTLDEAIQGTQLAIHKLDTARQGALRDLLTYGLDKTGRTRPKEDRSLFSITPLGLLPHSWSVANLGSLLTTERDPAMRSGPFGSELLKKDLVEEGIPLIGIDNVEVERFVPDFTRFITPWKFTDLSRYRSFPEDVLITIMGTVGRCCLVPENIGDALTTKHVWALSLDKERYSPYLTCLQINHAPWVLRHLNQDQQGGIMSAIRADTLRSILLPIPPREELEAIEAMLRSMGETIADEQKRLMKMRVLKSGLTSDLLTGRVRTVLH